MHPHAITKYFRQFREKTEDGRRLWRKSSSAISCVPTMRLPERAQTSDNQRIRHKHQTQTQRRETICSAGVVGTCNPDTNTPENSAANSSQRFNGTLKNKMFKLLYDSGPNSVIHDDVGKRTNYLRSEYANIQSARSPLVGVICSTSAPQQRRAADSLLMNSELIMPRGVTCTM